MTKEYKINGKLFSCYGVEVASVTGLFEDLPLKERIQENHIGQHGVLIDRTAMLYDKREIRLAIRVYNEIISAEKKYATFRSLFNSSVPLRLSAQFGYDVYVYDVDWGGESERVYFENNRGFIVTILLIETAPVKCVYSVTGAAASFTLAAKAGITLQPQVLVSWGDGTFTTSRNGAVTKTYTDGYTKHEVILSGRMHEVAITTNHTKLYEVKS
jgi:hypothetical protein